VPALCHLPAPFRKRVLTRLTWASLTWLSLGFQACSRTGLDAEGDIEQDHTAPAPDAAVDIATRAEASTEPRCVPAAETCNGLDDDCNGHIDDGIAPVPCPSGGHRYCVGGRSSACPTRCEVCVPGSQRVCFISYCLYWGTQTCAADGRSFGPCREQRPPAECDATARTHGASPELERCCVDHDYCCLDAYDLDNDGNRSELIGSCSAVSCEP
jgi:hypothetical protein